MDRFAGDDSFDANRSVNKKKGSQPHLQSLCKLYIKNNTFQYRLIIYAFK